MLKKLLISVLALGLCVGFAEDAKKAGKAKKADLAVGKKVFEKFCFICHGLTGKGDGQAAAALNPKPRNFGDTAYMSKQTREKLHGVIANGGKSAGLSVNMAAWNKAMKPEELDDVLAYVLHFSEDTASAIGISPPGREIDKVKPKEKAKDSGK